MLSRATVPFALVPLVGGRETKLSCVRSPLAVKEKREGGKSRRWTTMKSRGTMETKKSESGSEAASKK